MKILITSNCMTGGLVQALRVLLPNETVIPFPENDINIEVLNQHLKSVDVWLVSNQELLKRREIERPLNLSIVPFPVIFFRAFHPDQVYAWLRDDSLVTSPTGPYNSAIALWAWRNQMSTQDTIDLYTPEIFQSLGYHDCWNTALAQLEKDFSVCPDLSFHEFIDPLIRNGVFMHTINHPGVAAIAQLARVLATQINPSINYCEIPIEPLLVDGLLLASFAWSVYPSIANSLGFTGSFLWKLADHSIIGLEAFITQSFILYEAQQPNDIRCDQIKQPIYDEILSPHRSTRTR